MQFTGSASRIPRFDVNPARDVLTLMEVMISMRIIITMALVLATAILLGLVIPILTAGTSILQRETDRERQLDSDQIRLLSQLESSEKIATLLRKGKISLAIAIEELDRINHDRFIFSLNPRTSRREALTDYVIGKVDLQVRDDDDPTREAVLARLACERLSLPQMN